MYQIANCAFLYTRRVSHTRHGRSTSDNNPYIYFFVVDNRYNANDCRTEIWQFERSRTIRLADGVNTINIPVMTELLPELLNCYCVIADGFHFKSTPVFKSKSEHLVNFRIRKEHFIFQDYEKYYIKKNTKIYPHMTSAIINQCSESKHAKITWLILAIWSRDRSRGTAWPLVI